MSTLDINRIFSSENCNAGTISRLAENDGNSVSFAVAERSAVDSSGLGKDAFLNDETGVPIHLCAT